MDEDSTQRPEAVVFFFVPETGSFEIAAPAGNMLVEVDQVKGTLPTYINLAAAMLDYTFGCEIPVGIGYDKTTKDPTFTHYFFRKVSRQVKHPHSITALQHILHKL